MSDLSNYHITYLLNHVNDFSFKYTHTRSRVILKYFWFTAQPPRKCRISHIKDKVTSTAKVDSSPIQTHIHTHILTYMICLNNFCWGTQNVKENKKKEPKTIMLCLFVRLIHMLCSRTAYVRIFTRSKKIEFSFFEISLYVLCFSYVGLHNINTYIRLPYNLPIKLMYII
jgi:hypothetical protein